MPLAERDIDDVLLFRMAKKLKVDVIRSTYANL